VNAAPETLAQTRERDRTKTRYLRAGLCDPCAAQAAWAHQNHGDTWQTIHPACVACAPIVDLHPIADAQPLVAEVLQEAGVAVSITKGILDGSHPHSRSTPRIGLVRSSCVWCCGQRRAGRPHPISATGAYEE
jgi:hypothetical protein